MAEEGKTLGQLVADLQAEYGEHQYGRIDLHIPDEHQERAIARARALQPGDADIRRHAHSARGNAGRRQVLSSTIPRRKTKPNAAETWLLLRASGTEPLMRIYTESSSKEAGGKAARSRRAQVCAGKLSGGRMFIHIFGFRWKPQATDDRQGRAPKHILAFRDNIPGLD